MSMFITLNLIQPENKVNEIMSHSRTIVGELLYVAGQKVAETDDVPLTMNRLCTETTIPSNATTLVRWILDS